MKLADIHCNRTIPAAGRYCDNSNAETRSLKAAFTLGIISLTLSLLCCFVAGSAFASYAGSRYANGQQAARLVHKIVEGTAPGDIPIETPDKVELVINKGLVASLGIHLPRRIWQVADRIVDIQF